MRSRIATAAATSGDRLRRRGSDDTGGSKSGDEWGTGEGRAGGSDLAAGGPTVTGTGGAGDGGGSRSEGVGSRPVKPWRRDAPHVWQ